MGVTINSLQEKSKDLSDKIRDSKVKSEKLKKTWDSQPNRTRRSLRRWMSTRRGCQPTTKKARHSRRRFRSFCKKTQDSQRKSGTHNKTFAFPMHNSRRPSRTHRRVQKADWAERRRKRRVQKKTAELDPGEPILRRGSENCAGKPQTVCNQISKLNSELNDYKNRVSVNNQESETYKSKIQKLMAENSSMGDEVGTAQENLRLSANTFSQSQQWAQDYLQRARRC